MNNLRILYADDEQTDLALFGIAVDRLDYDIWLHTVQSGEEVIKYLQGEGEFADRALYAFPDLLVLDFKMIGSDGLEVLKWLKSKAQFSKLPVIVFTSWHPAEKLKAAADLGAREVIQKPISLREWGETVRRICELGLSFKASAKEPEA